MSPVSDPGELGQIPVKNAQLLNEYHFLNLLCVYDPLLVLGVSLQFHDDVILDITRKALCIVRLPRHDAFPISRTDQALGLFQHVVDKLRKGWDDSSLWLHTRVLQY